MLRALRNIALVGFVVIAAIAGAYGFLFWTPSGRTMLIPLIETRIEQALGGDAKIGALKGDLPSELIVENVSLSEHGTEWLSVQRAELHWRPFALLHGNIDIQSATIDQAKIINLPPSQSPNENKLRGFELPENLPSLSVGGIELNDLRVSEAIAGSDTRIDGGGSISMGGSALSIRLNLTSNYDRDFAAVRVQRSGDTLETEITIASKEDGVLARLSRLEGPLYVESRGAGPLKNYRLAVTSTLGAYGSIDGEIGGDFEKMAQIAFDLDINLQEKLANTARFLGSSIKMTGQFSPRPDGGMLTLSNVRSAFGAGAATLDWRNRNATLDTVKIGASATLAEDWRPDIRQFTGDHLAVDGEIKPKGKNFTASGHINASLLSGVLNGIETDLRTTARGPAEIVLQRNENLPALLAKGADASGAFDLIFLDGVSASSLKLTTSDGVTFAGDATYSFDSRRFAVKGDATATSESLQLIAPNMTAARNISAVVDIKGAPENFGGTVVATTPPILVGKSRFPAARSTLAFTGAPSYFAGQVSARTIDGNRKLTADFARSPEGAWRANGVDYVGSEFALKGSASYDPQRNEGAVDLTYRGNENAEPWPGLELVGDLTAKGAIAREASSNRLTLQSGALKSGAWSLGGFSASVEGPVEKLKVKAAASVFDADGIAPLSDVAAEMTALPGKPERILVTKFVADLGGASFGLTEPAEIILSDGIAVKKLRATIGQRGSVLFDGKFQKRRWQGTAKARRAPIVSAASVIDFDLDFDTDRNSPASGKFVLTSLISKTETASLSGRFSWNGTVVSIKDRDESRVFDLDLAVPARLTRSPSIKINTSGQITGTARYEGRVETVAGFLPVVLQSLEGSLVIDGKAAGTLANPKLTGELAVSNGAFTELSSGLSIVNIDATARADHAAQGSLINFTATGSGAGQKEKTVLAKGAVTLGAEPHFSSKVTLKDARFSAGPVSEVEATGDVDISGPFDAILAEGDISVQSLDARVFTPETTGLVDINVVAVNGNAAPAPLVAANNALSAIRYNIHIIGDDRIFVRGRGLESEWRADVTLTGRADAPTVVGDMSLRNGEITFAGRRFDMTRGVISFDRLSPNNPSLDLHAERTTQSGTLAAIDITGRARAPKIALDSTPALPQEDIMALILFDKPASELSAIESLQVADGLAELGGIGPFGGKGLTGSARQALGLDLLNIDIDQANSAASSLTVGKYVADGLFVSAKQDARGQNGSVRIEYEINDSFTVQTEIRQDGDQTVSANWKHDF